MHRTIGYLSTRFVQIRQGEGRKVFLTFLYFFLIMTAYYVIKPASRSLVLGELGSRMVPYVDLVCAVLMGPIVTLFARLVDRMSKPRLVGYSFWAVIGVLLVFWELLRWPVAWVAGAFYMWVAIFSVLVVTLFWLVANDLYHPREAKRLFGLIGSGGILGGITGSSIAAVGAQLIGTKHLLLLSSGLLALCWAVVQRLWTLAPEHAVGDAERPTPAARDTFLSDMRGFATLIWQSRYLRLLVAIVCLNKIAATLVYYQLNPFIEHAFPNPDARTTFTGMFFGGINTAAFIVQFFFTSWILRRWGLPAALLILPVGVLAGTTGLLFLPILWLAAGTELYAVSLDYSLQQTTKEVLYLPIDRSIRYKVKPFIDMVVFRFGKGIAAIIGIVLLDVWHAPSSVLSALTIPVILIWIAVAWQLHREYVSTIRTMLQARAASKRPHPQPSAAEQARGQMADVQFSSESPGQGGWRAAWQDEPVAFGSLTDGYPSAQKLALLDRLIRTETAPAPLAQDLVAGLTDYETGCASPSELDAEAARLHTVISDQRSSIAKRRRAIRLLIRCPDQRTVDYLFGVMMLENDAILRREAMRGLVRLRLHGRRFEFPPQAIHRQIASEVDNYCRIRNVAAVYQQYHPGPLTADDPALALLRVLLEESVEQIFRLLMLLYRPEDIHLVYEQMRAPDAYLRTDAIELLDNLIDGSLRATLFPILDEDRFLALGEGDEGGRAGHEPAAAYRILQEAIWDHNCWLSATTLCAVGRLRLASMRQEIEKASRLHQVPLVATAAKIALHLSTRP